MSEPHTKERIIEAAEEIMWKRSFHSVGLNEILKAVGVPKGSFYHWFESKEHFGVELLKHYIAAATDEKNHALFSDQVEKHPMKRLIAFLETSIVKFEESGKKCPCLVLKLASEVTDLSEPMRQVLAGGMKTWLGLLAGVFDEAKVLGYIRKDVDPAAEAELFRDLWAGAIQRSTICRSTAPMHRALAFLSARIATYSRKPSLKNQPALKP
jgi:TetR/AcrR family transcriptional repressor of nem operon